MALTREEIVAAAVALLDQVGLEGLTLRKLADQLGVRAPTLYWHVAHKRELLDLMAEAILAEVEPDGLSQPRPGQLWWEWLGERSRLMFRALIAHRDAALVLAGNRPTEQSRPQLEAVLASLVAQGFSPTEALQIIFTLGTYVIGCAIEWQAEAARAADPPAQDVGRRQRLDVERFPQIAAAVDGLHRLDRHATFEYGLIQLLAGLRLRHSALVADGSSPARREESLRR